MRPTCRCASSGAAAGRRARPGRDRRRRRWRLTLRYRRPGHRAPALRSLLLHDVQAPSTATDVVRHHLAMQAQDWRASTWVVGSRMAPDATLAHVHAAYDAGELVPRGRCAAPCTRSSPRTCRGCSSSPARAHYVAVQRRWEFLGIDEHPLERARDAAIELLRGGGRCTRAQLTDALAEAGLDLAGHAPTTRSGTWRRPDARARAGGRRRAAAGAAGRVDPEPAAVRRPRRRARRAGAPLPLASHAPATAHDLQWWTGLTLNDSTVARSRRARTIHAGARPARRLLGAREDVDARLSGRVRARTCRRSRSPRSTSTCSLQGPRRGARSRARAPRLTRAATACSAGTIVERGRVVATWSRTRLTRHVRCELQPFARRAVGATVACMDRRDRALGAFHRNRRAGRAALTSLTSFRGRWATDWPADLDGSGFATGSVRHTTDTAESRVAHPRSRT